MKKRIISGLLIVSLLISLIISIIPAVSAEEASYKVKTLQDLGIMTGDENGNLHLDRTVTRAEFITLMARASTHKDDTITVSSTLFTDVDKSHWANGYINLAINQKWMIGFTDGSFRPNKEITLEEGCTALLRMIGYDTSSLVGFFPTAQLSKSEEIGLLDDMTLKQGNILTRMDCVDLFYNLLFVKTAQGQVCANLLGYAVKDDKIEYSSIIEKDLKGPYIAVTDGYVDIEFVPTTIYKNNESAGIGSIFKNDVYYYNKNLKSLWVYDNKFTGTLTDILPNKISPTSIVISGQNYVLETQEVKDKLSVTGSLKEGQLVTILTGKDGKVVDIITDNVSGEYYGVVLKSEKVSSSQSTSQDNLHIQVSTDVICTDGVVRKFYTDGETFTKKGLVSVKIDGSNVSIKRLREERLEGQVKEDNNGNYKVCGYSLASNYQILEIDKSGNYKKTYVDRLSGCKLKKENILYYSLNSSNEMEKLIIQNVTGDLDTYIYVTDETEITVSMMLSSSYTYLLNGNKQVYGSKSAVYPIDVGGAVIVKDEDNAIKSFKQLKSVKLEDVNQLEGTVKNKKYKVSENVQVYLRDTKLENDYEKIDIKDINADDFVLTAWYDDMDYPAGNIIRIIIASMK